MIRSDLATFFKLFLSFFFFFKKNIKTSFRSPSVLRSNIYNSSSLSRSFIHLVYFSSFVLDSGPHPMSGWHCQPIPGGNSNRIVPSNDGFRQFCIFHRTLTIWITVKFVRDKDRMEKHVHQIYRYIQIV